jgi:hypothetical protein
MTAAPFYFTVTLGYEDAKGNLTGDQDQFTFYAADTVTTMAVLGAAGGKTFIFTRGPCRIVDINCGAAGGTDTLVLQLYVNNSPKNIRYRTAGLLGANMNRIPSPVRISAGSQIEFYQATT